MGKCDHQGHRRPRHERIQRRNLELGYYLIYTDTKKTEKSYFEGLHESLPEEIREKLQLKVVDDIKTRELVNKALEDSSYDFQFRSVWIVFDRDKVTNFDNIIEKAESNNINVGWSNPCIEIWLHAYLGVFEYTETSTKCCDRLKSKCYQLMKKYEYNKKDKRIYQHFCRYGDEKKAISLAKARHNSFLKDGVNTPSKMNPCTTIYKLVEEIQSKINND